jgi:hypothetical protein
VRPGRTAFKVTPKEGVDFGGWDALRQLPAVLAIAALLGGGVVLRILQEAGVPLFLPSLRGIALWIVPLVGVFELRRVLRTLAIVARRRQRRIEYRMALDAPAAVVPSMAGALRLLGRARDVSPSGLGLCLPAPLEPGTAVRATVQLPGIDGEAHPVELDLRVQSCRVQGEGWTVGARIVGAGAEAGRRLVEYCYVVHQAERLRAGGPPVALPRPVVVSDPVATGAFGTEPAMA